MTRVSTNGRSTPWNTGGSWRSLMIPTGASTFPARRLKGRLTRKSTYACSSSSSPPVSGDTAACSSSSSDTKRTRSEKAWVKSSTKRWKSSTGSACCASLTWKSMYPEIGPVRDAAAPPAAAAGCADADAAQPASSSAAAVPRAENRVSCDACSVF